jgi:type VI secretion system protein ImpH
LVGLGLASLRGRLAVQDETFLYYGGHFVHRPRNAISLEVVLEDYLGLPVRLDQFQGQWLSLSEEYCTQFPGPSCPKGRNFELGNNLVAGRRVWDVQTKFRLRLGSLTYDEFRQCMPDGAHFRKLCQLTRLYVGPEMDFEVQPVLKREEVPRMRLVGEGSGRCRLGWDTWLNFGAVDRDADDVLFQCPA